MAILNIAGRVPQYLRLVSRKIFAPSRESAVLHVSHEPENDNNKLQARSRERERGEERASTAVVAYTTADVNGSSNDFPQCRVTELLDSIHE